MAKTIHNNADNTDIAGAIDEYFIAILYVDTTLILLFERLGDVLRRPHAERAHGTGVDYFYASLENDFDSGCLRQ